ncbi:hypothetical protein BSZ36_12925 [Rubricoccus marinus]|uniref:Secretion system C-terminal sorting domain-containing protein n=1 Tax=Rubricoccus marinus TaxID=716817 RepID=A0A259U1D0_9BACT|nr:hypothetical protein BSZ36_12925 [Rubricoccus marinus]
MGTAEADLDINNIFARVFNTGSLFFGNTTTNGDGYLAPKASENSPIFASGIWVGGKINGDLRVAGSRYSNFNFWPGPLGNDGRPVNPNNCSAYDEIYSVTRTNIANYEAGLAETGDLEDWPFEIGAPVIDGDGIEGNYNLAGGDRPEIIGDQGIFWVMNDVGNEHSVQATDPLGIEVQVLAFSFSRADALGETTFYRYRIINKGATPIEETYISVFSDPDLGDAGDDYVSYDQELGLGYVYNSNPADQVYGEAPPAAGYDFFQGPIVGTDTLDATAFSYFINGSSPTTTGDPVTGQQMYFYMQGLWGDGSPMRANGTGYQQPTTFPITKFAFPGDPVTGQTWSEVNIDGNGTSNPAGDRRLVIHTGPFTLERNDPQDIVFGIVFAQGADRFSSITALRSADRLAQTAYDNDFKLAPPPPAPPRCQPGSDVLAPGSGNCLEAISQDGETTLVWGYPSNNANYLARFEAVDVLLDPEEVDDNTYNFEGFNIYRYPTSDFDESARELVATYDIVNGVTRVIDLVFDGDLGDLAPKVVARGTDSGIQYSYRIQNVTNYTDYYYGVSAYSFNEESTPKVIESSPTQITARPSALTSGNRTQSQFADELQGVAVQQVGEGTVSATIVDPTAVTGDTYRVEFFTNEDDGSTTYSIINATTGRVALDGREYYDRDSTAVPQGRNIAVIDGLSFSVQGPAPEFTNFATIQNAAGPLLHPAAPAFAGYPTPGGIDPVAGTQQSTNNRRYFVGPAEALTGHTLDEFNENVGGIGTSREDSVVPFDWEIRFTGETNYAAIYSGTTFGPPILIEVPFELWNTGIATPDDTSDDVRYFPTIFDLDFSVAPGGQAFSFINTPGIQGTFGCCSGDSQMSSLTNDPYTDGITWIIPQDRTPGESGYNAIVAAIQSDPAAAAPLVDNGRASLLRSALVWWNGGDTEVAGAFDQFAFPEEGTIFRLSTSKPNQPGDVFTLDTSGNQLLAGSAEDAVAALENIQVVPNPYLGASTYETGNLSRVVRFTNLPEQASTIRVFTVAGTLVKTLRKEGSSRSLDWNLETENNLPVASGMYLIHVDVEGVGERTLKLGVVQRRTQITVF